MGGRLGVMRKALSAVAAVHLAGVAHRSLSAGSIALTSGTQNKAVALERCTPGLLVVQLTDLSLASRLADDADERLSACGRWGVDVAAGGALALTALSIAEDLRALGQAFVGLLFGALATAEDPAGGGVGERLVAQIDDVFKGDVRAWRDFVAADERLERVVELLDSEDGAGWDLLETMLGARERVAKKGSGAGGMVTAAGLERHPFFEAAEGHDRD